MIWRYGEAYQLGVPYWCSNSLNRGGFFEHILYVVRRHLLTLLQSQKMQKSQLLAIYYVN